MIKMKKITVIIINCEVLGVEEGGKLSLSLSLLSLSLSLSLSLTSS